MALLSQVHTGWEKWVETEESKPMKSDGLWARITNQKEQRSQGQERDSSSQESRQGGSNSAAKGGKELHSMRESPEVLTQGTPEPQSPAISSRHLLEKAGTGSSCTKGSPTGKGSVVVWQFTSEERST